MCLRACVCERESARARGRTRQRERESEMCVCVCVCVCVCACVSARVRERARASEQARQSESKRVGWRGREVEKEEAGGRTGTKRLADWMPCALVVLFEDLDALLAQNELTGKVFE